jgi:hypothetical protein
VKRRTVKNSRKERDEKGEKTHGHKMELEDLGLCLSLSCHRLILIQIHEQTNLPSSSSSRFETL